MATCSALKFSVVQHSLVQFNDLKVQCDTVQHSLVPCSTMQHIAQCTNKQYGPAVLHNTVECPHNLHGCGTVLVVRCEIQSRNLNVYRLQCCVLWVVQSIHCSV